MWIVGTLGSVALIFFVLLDSFETTVLPRRVTHSYRFARLYFRANWGLWRQVALHLPSGKVREAFLSVYGTLSLLGLLASWVVGLIFGFALLHWSLDTALQTPDGDSGLSTYLYWSGVTFFTLGYGEVTPLKSLGRFLAVFEAGLGFGFLAIIIGYLPLINQVFSRREVTISLLDARAGSPPTAGQLLLRLARSGKIAAVDPILAEWERWAAEVLESHLSFPVLSTYRSQHDNQSWLAALTAMLDTCAFLLVGIKGYDPYQAKLTFAMARHTAVDLTLILKVPPLRPARDRLPPERLARFRGMLREAGFEPRSGPAADDKLTKLRGLYEPFVHALGERVLFAIPPMIAEEISADNWQRSPGMGRTRELGWLGSTADGDGHFG